MTNSSVSKYSVPARFFHWLIAGLIVTQYILAELAENAEDNDKLVQQLALLANHKSVGMTIVMLAVMRLLWRVFNRPPPTSADMPIWQHRASVIAHWLLYGLIFAIPISGWLMSSANAYSVSWFNLFVFPDLVSASESLASQLHEIHEVLAELLFVIALVHILAALKHHFVDKDDVLARMSSASMWALFVTVIAAVMVTLAFPSSGTRAVIGGDNRSESVISVTGSVPDSEATASDLPAWEIDYASSHIKFSGDQAGAPFTGTWQRWSAELQFAADQLNASRFNVAVETGSAFSNDETRDEHISSPEFFDAENFNQAIYSASQFKETGGGSYTAAGRLSMKGLAHPVDLEFTITESSNTTVLTGQAIINRLAWNIGTGDWADTTWVGQDIQVDVRVVASQ